MRTTLALFLALTVSLASAQAAAQDLPPAPNVDLFPLKTGERSPYPGVLLSANGVATIMADYQLFDQKLKIELDKLARDKDALHDTDITAVMIRCDTDKSILNAQIAASLNDNKVLLDRNKLLEKRKGRTWVWVTLGVVAGAVVTGLGSYAVIKATH